MQRCGWIQLGVWLGVQCESIKVAAAVKEGCVWAGGGYLNTWNVFQKGQAHPQHLLFLSVDVSLISPHLYSHYFLLLLLYIRL